MNPNIVFHGKMPDPFLKEDGTRMTPEEWAANKNAIRDKIVDIEYGGMPPRPEYLRVEQLSGLRRDKYSTWFKIYAGTKEKQLSFTLELYVPHVPGISPTYMRGPAIEGEKYPVLLTGDACYCNLESDTVKEARKHGMIVAIFNRLELANDIHFNRDGGLHDIYEGDYSDMSAWAWGYMTCMDAFEQLSFVDETEVAITGHSRGGKTVLLAGAMDERIKYVCPNNSGCHGVASYRCDMLADEEKGLGRSEVLDDLLRGAPTWMGPQLYDYKGRVNELPYDMHYFGAMVAPRYYIQMEGMQDYWSNPVGSWQTLMAVKACYKHLGYDEDRAVAWFRPGDHRHELPDFSELIEHVARMQKGLPVSEHLLINPYPTVERNFDW